MARQPGLFVPHGAPSFALEPGQAGRVLAALGRTLVRPSAVLVVSPHWVTERPRVGVMPMPRTLHDFAGFEPSLYTIEYPAPGHPGLAYRAFEQLERAGWRPQTEAHRGLDHGAWLPLRYLFPLADVPVFQVSMPAALESESAWRFGESLAPLADEGVLVVGSGNLTHNLRDLGRASGGEADYVTAFPAWVRGAIEEGNGARLRRAMQEAPHAGLAHPTPEHFLPLLVAAGAAAGNRPWRWIAGGSALGALAMDAVLFGSTGHKAPPVDGHPMGSAA